MSMGVCFDDLVARGKLRPATADRLRPVYDELVAQYEGKYGRSAAEAMATEQALKTIDHDLLQRKRRTLMQAKSQGEWLADMKIAAGDGALPIKHAVASMARIDKQRDAIRGRLFRRLDGFLADHRRNLLGEVRHKAELDDIGRAVFGEKVDSMNARELGSAIKDTLEEARQMYNAAGGAIGRLESYGLPQRHDSARVRAVSYETWRSHPSMERLRVLDVETGDLATGIRRETILRGAYEAIRTEGTSRAKPGATFAGSMATRRSDPRVLHWDNFDDWKSYQAQYGGGNIYDILGSHLGSMARDIALMRALGPNPAASLRFQQDWIEKSVRDVGSEKQIKKVRGMRNSLGSMYDELSGVHAASENERLTLAFSIIRSGQIAAKLGGATLSAIPDFATMLVTARFNGIPAMKMLKRYVKLYNPVSAADRRQAVRAGLVTDEWINLSSSAVRYTGEELGSEFGRRLADGVIRASFLSMHTRHGQWAMGMEAIGHLTEMRAHAFDDIHPATRRALKGYGVDASDWESYRAAPVVKHGGVDWAYPVDADPKVGDKLMEFILSETDYGVLMPDIRTRTTLNSNFRRGTWLGETLKSTVLFKSFPMTMYNLHLRRIMMLQGGARLRYIIAFVPTLLAAGALSAQLKMIAAGKDPQPMNNPKFAGKAIAQSGGLGLAGDLLYNSQNSYGGGMLQTLAGPVLGQTIPNIFDATIGNAQRAADGDPKTKARPVRDIAKTIEAEIPGRNLWYTRFIYERLIADEIRRQTDPEAEKAFKRQASRAAQEGTEYWAPPGEGLPARGPDFGNAIGE